MSGVTDRDPEHKLQSGCLTEAALAAAPRLRGLCVPRGWSEAAPGQGSRVQSRPLPTSGRRQGSAPGPPTPPTGGAPPDPASPIRLSTTLPLGTQEGWINVR